MRIASKLTVLLLLCSTASFAQNLIKNPDFESGPLGTQVSSATGWSNNCGRVWVSGSSSGAPGSPDLFDTQSPQCLYGVPDNKWGSRSDHSGGRRYVGFSGDDNYTHGSQWFGETVQGTLLQTLGACSYRVSFWASAVDGIRQQCSDPITPYGPSPYDQVEVVLRKAGNCSSGKSVYVSPTVGGQTWHQYSGQFTLSAADAAASYDRIEFRLIQEPSHTPWTFHIVYLDDVELVSLAQSSTLDPDFQLTATMPSGSSTTYQLTATSAPLPSGAYFSWQVQEIDIATGAVVPSTTMTNPAAWWGNPTVNVFQGYYNNSSSVGVFQRGHKYRIERAVWSSCSPWKSVTKVVYMCSNC